MITRSQRVRAEDFDADWFKSRAVELGQEVGQYHRKIWEFAIIAQVFRDHVLAPLIVGGVDVASKPALRVLGFGCGKEEPLPKYFLDQGMYVVATDGPDNSVWSTTGQLAKSAADLGIAEPTSEAFSFRCVDMNAIPDDLLQGQFDFTWSCGSFEHIGGIDQSLEFFRNQMRALKPGGIACHTTELNYYLDAEMTLETDNLVLFRTWDLGMLAGMLWRQGDKLWLPDLRPGYTAADTFIDRPPYTAPYHLNIEIGGYVTTSVVLIVTRGTGETRS